MKTRYIIGTIATLGGGPLLIAGLVVPAPAVHRDATLTMPTGAASAALALPVAVVASAAATATPPAADAPAMSGGTMAVLGAAPLLVSPAGDTASVGAFTSLYRTAEANLVGDDPFARAAPVSDFTLPVAGLDGGLGNGGGFDEGVAIEDQGELRLLAGFGSGAGGGAGFANRPAIAAAAARSQSVSGVPEPASWISFIAGLALVGFNLRDRARTRNVVC